MRLLSFNTTAKRFELDNFHGQSAVPYAILSHTWGPANEEITFDDIESPHDFGAGKQSCVSKLKFAHAKAVLDGLLYIWVDTCCIKKSDSTELQRSLASMFSWCQRAARCYVWLQDVLLNEVEMPVNEFARVDCEEHRSKAGGPIYKTENDLANLLWRFGVGYDYIMRDRNHYERHLGKQRGALADLKRLEVAWRSCGVTAINIIIDLEVWIAEKMREAIWS